MKQTFSDLIQAASNMLAAEYEDKSAEGYDPIAFAPTQTHYDIPLVTLGDIVRVPLTELFDKNGIHLSVFFGSTAKNPRVYGMYVALKNGNPLYGNTGTVDTGIRIVTDSVKVTIPAKNKTGARVINCMCAMHMDETSETIVDSKAMTEMSVLEFGKALEAALWGIPEVKNLLRVTELLDKASAQLPADEAAEFDALMKGRFEPKESFFLQDFFNPEWRKALLDAAKVAGGNA